MQIPANRKRIPLLLIAGLVIILLLSWAVIQSIHSEDDNAKQMLYVYIGLLVSASYYSSLALADYGRTLFNRKASLAIEPEGLRDSLSLFSCGRIPWREIAGVEVRKTFQTEFLVIHVHRPEALIARQSAWKRRTLKGFAAKWGSPVVISQNRVQPGLTELQALIMGQLQARQGG